MTDHYTHFTVERLIKNLTTLNGTHSLAYQRTSFIGVLTQILTARGTQFEATLFNEIKGFVGSLQRQAATFHTQANGMV